MFCIKCGKEVKDGTKFCTNCGADLSVQDEKVKEVKEDDGKLSYSQNSQIATSTNPTPAAVSTTTNGQKDGQATASLVLGIVSFVVPCVGFITSIVGLILGIVSKEKSGKRTAGIILNAIALGLIIVGSILAYTTGYVESFYNNTSTYNYNSQSNTNNKSTTTSTINGAGATFYFDDFQVSYGNNYSFVKLDNSYSKYYNRDVIKIPMRVKNISSTSKGLNMFYYTLYGPDGTKIDRVATYFSSDAFDYAGKLQPGASYDKYFYILYDGDGKYTVEWYNYQEKKNVVFNIVK